RVPPFVHRTGHPVVHRRPEIVHRAAKKAAREFECRRQTGPAGGADRRTIRAVKIEARNQRMRMEIRKASAAGRVNEGLILLRLYGTEIVLRGFIDRARLRMVNSKIQPEAVPDLEGI